MSPRAPVIVVLAAGRGSRFSGAGHKLSESVGALTVLGMTLASVIESDLPLVVVTTQALAAEAARHVATRDLVVLSETDAARGMGHSIVAGVAARADAPGWLILPGDMPLVRPSTLKAVARALLEHPLVHAQHRGRRGHPVGFGAELFSELMALSGDEGARRLLARYPAQPIEVDDPGVLMDIDTTDDLAAARGQITSP